MSDTETELRKLVLELLEKYEEAASDLQAELRLTELEKELLKTEVAAYHNRLNELTGG